MTEHRKPRQAGAAGTPVTGERAPLTVGAPAERPFSEPVLAAGPVSRTTLRARLALLRLRPLKAQSARAGRS
jgi:hypothetical protein